MYTILNPIEEITLFENCIQTVTRIKNIIYKTIVM